MLFQNESNSLGVWAPAKLNLFLEVLGKRSDGYHELETLMVSIGLYDTLRFRTAAPGTLQLKCVAAPGLSGRHSHETAPAIPTGPQNLVYRAAEVLRSEAGVAAGVQIELCKRIPLESGLAGGSTDAAAALVGLNRFWKLNLPAAELQRIAAQLGSDVPFFIESPVAAVCRGRGERVEPFLLSRPLFFVIVRPHSGLSTALVFRHCRPASKPESVRPLVDALQKGDLGRAGQLFHNELQQPAETLDPEITRVKAAFSKLPVLGHVLSGSGTSYFALCANRRQALQISMRIKANRIGTVFVAQSRT